MIRVLCLIAGLLATAARAESPIVLSLTRDEAQALRNGISAIIKGGGTEAAEVFLPIDHKLTAAAREAQDIDLTEAARKKVEEADKAKEPK